MSDELYINLAKADLINSLSCRKIDENEFKYLARQIDDKNYVHELIFDIYRNLNKEVSHHNIQDVIEIERNDIYDIVNMVCKTCNLNIDIDFHVNMWMYSIFIKQNNNISYSEREEYLNNISPSNFVSKFFLLEYYNGLLDNVIGINPIDLEKLDKIKNQIRNIL